MTLNARIIKKVLFIPMMSLCLSCGDNKPSPTTYQVFNTATGRVDETINAPPISSTPLAIKLSGGEFIKTAFLMKYLSWTPQVGWLVRPKYLMQQYCLTNIPVIDDDEFRSARDPDVGEVCFTINETLLSEDSFDPIQPGNYGMRSTGNNNMRSIPGVIGTVSTVTLRMRYNERVRLYTLDYGKSYGNISIEYADKKRIKGKIDLLDGVLSVNGEFDAEIQNKPGKYRSS